MLSILAREVPSALASTVALVLLAWAGDESR